MQNGRFVHVSQESVYANLVCNENHIALESGIRIRINSDRSLHLKVTKKTSEEGVDLFWEGPRYVWVGINLHKYF